VWQERAGLWLDAAHVSPITAPTLATLVAHAWATAPQPGFLRALCLVPHDLKELPEGGIANERVNDSTTGRQKGAEPGKTPWVRAATVRACLNKR
jgi:hypothetical protein